MLLILTFFLSKVIKIQIRIIILYSKTYYYNKCFTHMHLINIVLIKLNLRIEITPKLQFEFILATFLKYKFSNICINKLKNILNNILEYRNDSALVKMKLINEIYNYAIFKRV